MGSKTELCLYCGRYTTEKNPRDGLAECSRPECVVNRERYALLSVVESVVAWCEATGADILSTFDITDDDWDIIRPLVNKD